jgi:bacillithiol system protein YtxJ
MMAYNRMEQMAGNNDAAFFLLDVLKSRPISLQIAEEYHVHHESPQALLIVNGECVYDESHSGIIPAELKSEIKEWREKMATSN